MDEHQKAQVDKLTDAWTDFLMRVKVELERFVSDRERRKAWERGEAEMVVRQGQPVFFRQVADEDEEEPGGLYL